MPSFREEDGETCRHSMSGGVGVQTTRGWYGAVHTGG